MKYVKMMGISAIAALALMAVVGAGTASATKLCQNNTTDPCSAAYGANTQIAAALATGTVAELSTNIGVVKCTTSATTGETTNAGGGAGTPVLGTIATLTFEGCTLNKTACNVTVLNLPYNGSIAWTAGKNGTLSVTSGGTGNPGATVVCGGILNCTFNTATAILNVTGGAPASALANEIELTRAGLICPETAKWKATYSVSAPNPLYVTNG